MRHIPEDELHSYLDQALSRSQCVEIERHLARCAACRASRDDIAALRDRTTALLSALSPVRHRIPPSWDSISGRAEARVGRRTGLRRVGLWAASLVAAVGLGWGSQTLMHQPTTNGRPMAQAAPDLDEIFPAGFRTGVSTSPTAASRNVPRPRSAPAAAKGTTHRATAERPPVADSNRVAPARAPNEPVGARLSAGRLPPTDFDYVGGGMWRTLSWDNARSERGESVPRISGLPVLEVQVAAAHDSSGKPTMIVAQQLRSGQLIRTIEGPATDVTRLLASQHPESSSPWPTIEDSSAVPGGTMAMRRGDRILAIQASPSVPPDSLRAMIRRLNAANR